MPRFDATVSRRKEEEEEERRRKEDKTRKGKISRGNRKRLSLDDQAGKGV